MGIVLLKCMYFSIYYMMKFLGILLYNSKIIFLVSKEDGIIVIVLNESNCELSF